MNDDFVIKINDKITKLSIKRKVFNAGTGGAVSIPKSLIGENVRILYNIDFKLKDEEKNEYKEGFKRSDKRISEKPSKNGNGGSNE